MIKTKRQAFATHCGMDFADTEDFRYRYGRTSQPVWAFDKDTYCVTKGNQKPAIDRSGTQWKWVEVKDPYVNQFGFKIWKSKDGE
jgi:hypothetical protein